MRRLIYIVIVVVFTILFPNCSTPDKNYGTADPSYIWSRRGTIELVYAFLKDYNSNRKDSSLNRIIKDYNNKFIKEIETQPPDSLFSHFESISPFLQSHSLGIIDTLINIPLRKRSESIVNQTFDDNFFIIDFSNNEFKKKIGDPFTTSAFNNAIKSIQVKYKNAIDLNQSDKHSKFDLVDYFERNLLVSILIFFSLIFLFLIYKIAAPILNRKENQPKRKKHHNSNAIPNPQEITRKKEKHSGNSKLLKTEIRDFVPKETEKINIIEQNNEFLVNKDAVTEINQDNSNYEDTNIEKETDNDSVENVILEPNEKVFYFSIPDLDGSFNVDKAESSYDDRKYYKIVCKTGYLKGSLYFLPGMRDNRAINNVDYYLLPVCEIDNILNRNEATRIEILNQGEVELIDNTWHIIKKVKIKFL